MDESERRQGPGVPMYLIGACICSLREEHIREILDPLKPVKASKLHWRDMTSSEKQRSITTINTLGLTQIVVIGLPLAGRAERARRKCMEVLLPILETRGVNNLVCESRDEHQDVLDFQFIQALRSRRIITPRLRVDFVSGRSDARLWIPDQILGAIGDQQQRGEQMYDELNRIVELHVIHLG